MSKSIPLAQLCVRAFVLFAAFVITGLAFVPQSANGQSAGQTRMLRTPTLSATQIAFAYAQNIWTVPRGGGSARRLTSFQGQTSNPHFSPDGKWIAFSGEYAGNLDVYVVAAEGGEPRRLTWHPGADLVQGWTPDGKSILFSSTRATWTPSGAPRFWIVPAESGIEAPMSPPWAVSKDMDPVWVGDSVYFISDRDGVANVWSYDTKGKKLAQVTRFDDFDVKTMDSGAGGVVFEQGGYIHELDTKSGKEHVVNITASG